MRNIVLFQPIVGYMDSFRTQPSVPLGLLACSRFLDKKYEIRIIDQRLENDWMKKLNDYVNKDTICVGVTSLTGKMIKEGLKFSQYVKEVYNIPVVWGGVHPTILPSQTVKNKYIDIVVVGEGEITFYELVKTLEIKGDLIKVKGIYFKNNGDIVFSGYREFCDLESLPEVPYHLVDINKYLPKYKQRKSIFFESSRGCPFNCSYCYNNVVNKRKWRCMSPEKTLKQINNLVKKYSVIEDIYFVDDNFFIDTDRVEKIALGIKKFNITWQVQGVDIIHLKKLSDKTLELIKDSGCTRLTIGIETGSLKMRKLVNKQGSIEDIINVMTKLKKFNFIIYCSFLVGLPDEDIDDIKASINLLIEMFKINSNVRNSPFYLYSPYPGTPLCEMLKKQGYKLPESLEEWSEFEWDNSKLKPLIKQKNFYDNLHFVSLFVDKKTKEYNVPFFINLFLSLYRPIAIFRLKKLFFKFMIEKLLYRIATFLWKKH